MLTVSEEDEETNIMKLYRRHVYWYTCDSPVLRSLGPSLTFCSLSVVEQFNTSSIHSPERVVWSLLHVPAAADEPPGVVGSLATTLGIRRSILKLSVTTDRLQLIIRSPTATGSVARPFLNNPLTADLADDVIRRVNAV